MQARTFAAAVVVLLTLVVGAQLAYTEVGQPVGQRWSDPTVAAAIPAGESRGVVEVAAAGGEAGGAVAWLTRDGERYAVHVVRVSVDAGRVSIEDPRTVVSGSRELQGLDVTAAEGAVALAWERSFGNDVVLHRANETRVVSADPLRVEEPSVAIADNGTVVAWQERNGTRFAVQLAAVADGAVTYRQLAVATGGSGSPAVGGADGGFTVTWFDAGSQTVRTAFGRIGPNGPTVAAPVTLGQARPSGSFGGGTSSVTIDGASADDRVRGVWQDLGVLTTAETRRSGAPGEATELGRGDRPRIATAGDRWLAAWVVTGRTADNDIVFASDDTDGVLSRFPSSANHPSPFYAPDGAVAWSERGAESRVLVSGFRGGGGPRVVDRLRSEPGRLVFVGLAAAFIAVVMLPVMPWVFISLLVAFYATNRFVRDRFVRLLAWLGSLAGRETGEADIRQQLEAVPALGWAGVFAVGEVALLVYLLPPVGANVSLSFAGPVTLSAAAAAGTGLLQLVEPQRSPWRIAAIFAYLQTAALWATALPDVL